MTIIDGSDHYSLSPLVASEVFCHSSFLFLLLFCLRLSELPPGQTITSNLTGTAVKLKVISMLQCSPLIGLIITTVTFASWTLNLLEWIKDVFNSVVNVNNILPVRSLQANDLIIMDPWARIPATSSLPEIHLLVLCLYMQGCITDTRPHTSPSSFSSTSLSLLIDISFQKYLCPAHVSSHASWHSLRLYLCSTQMNCAVSPQLVTACWRE